MPILGLEKDQFLPCQKVVMRAHRKKEAPPQFLSGWKEIAGYLGKGVRTVQRYERELALPVRRPAGKASGSVVATKAELDGWVQASPIHTSFLLSPRVEDLSQGTTEAIRNNVALMMELRSQMRQLRAEVKISLDLLRHSVQGLQGTLRANISQQRNLSATFPDSELESGYSMELLGLDLRRKAS